MLLERILKHKMFGCGGIQLAEARVTWADYVNTVISR
jgi:hypothetical protein